MRVYRKTIIRLMIKIIILLIIVIAAFYNGLIIKKYNIHTDKFESNKSIRAALIADLHSCIYGHHQNTLSCYLKGSKILLRFFMLRVVMNIGRMALKTLSKQHDDLIHIVSRGVSFEPRLSRIFNPSEIVVIDIVKAI